MDKKILATVSGRDITEEGLNYAITRFPEDRRRQFAGEEGRKQLLNEMISWELCVDYAVEEEFEKRDDFKFQMEEARKSILTQLAIQNIISKVTVEDSEIEEYYNEHKDFFKEMEQVSAKHILVNSLDEANEIKEKVNSGLSFEEAARKYSTCPSKDQGGNLGYFSRGMMVPEFEEVAFKLEKGVVSEPVKTQFGYHLIVVEDKVSDRVKSFDEVKEQIKYHILGEKQNYTYMKFIEDLKQKYDVKIY